jgi:hypothetical protein
VSLADNANARIHRLTVLAGCVKASRSCVAVLIRGLTLPRFSRWQVLTNHSAPASSNARFRRENTKRFRAGTGNIKVCRRVRPACDPCMSLSNPSFRHLDPPRAWIATRKTIQLRAPSASYHRVPARSEEPTACPEAFSSTHERASTPPHKHGRQHP